MKKFSKKKNLKDWTKWYRKMCGRSFYIPSGAFGDTLVDTLLEGRLGDKAHLVVRYLGRPGPRRNTMPVLHTARASIR